MTTNPSVPTYVTVMSPVQIQASSLLAKTVVDYVYTQSGQSLQVRYAPFSVSGAGDNTVVAGVADFKIRVLSYLLAPNGVVDIRWESGTGSVYLTGGGTGAGRIPLAANEKVQDQDPYGVFETDSGDALNLNTSGAVVINGRVTYVLVPA